MNSPKSKSPSPEGAGAPTRESTGCAGCGWEGEHSPQCPLLESVTQQELQQARAALTALQEAHERVKADHADDLRWVFLQLTDAHKALNEPKSWVPPSVRETVNRLYEAFYGDGQKPVIPRTEIAESSLTACQQQLTAFRTAVEGLRDEMRKIDAKEQVDSLSSHTDPFQRAEASLARHVYLKLKALLTSMQEAKQP